MQNGAGWGGGAGEGKKDLPNLLKQHTTVIGSLHKSCKHLYFGECDLRAFTYFQPIYYIGLDSDRFDALNRNSFVCLLCFLFPPRKCVFDIGVRRHNAVGRYMGAHGCVADAYECI